MGSLFVHRTMMIGSLSPSGLTSVWNSRLEKWLPVRSKIISLIKAMPTGHSHYIPRSFVLLTNQTVQKQDSRNCIAIAALQNSDLYAGLT